MNTYIGYAVMAGLIATALGLLRFAVTRGGYRKTDWLVVGDAIRCVPYVLAIFMGWALVMLVFAAVVKWAFVYLSH